MPNILLDIDKTAESINLTITKLNEHLHLLTLPNRDEREMKFIRSNLATELRHAAAHLDAFRNIIKYTLK